MLRLYIAERIQTEVVRQEVCDKSDAALDGNPGRMDEVDVEWLAGVVGLSPTGVSDEGNPVHVYRCDSGGCVFLLYFYAITLPH